MVDKYTKTQLTVAKRLKEKREENRYTLEEAAKYINVSKVTLHRYENLDILNIPSDKIETLAKLYKTTPKYIMGWDENKEKTDDKESVKTVARNEKIINKFDKLSESKKKIVEDLINSYFDEDIEDEE